MQRGEGPRAQPAGQAQQRRDAEIGEPERRASGDREQRRGSVERCEHDVAGGCTEQGREQHPSGQVVLVWHLQGEDHSGRRCLEDGGDARRGTRHEEHLGVVAGEEPAEPVLETGSDRRTEVDGRTLESHGRARAEGGGAGDEPAEHGSEIEASLAVVEALDVLLRGRRRGSGRQPSQCHQRRPPGRWRAAPAVRPPAPARPGPTTSSRPATRTPPLRGRSTDP